MCKDDGCVGTERVHRTNYIIVNFDFWPRGIGESLSWCLSTFFSPHLNQGSFFQALFHIQSQNQLTMLPPILECSEYTVLFFQNSTWTTVDSTIHTHLAYPPYPTMLDNLSPISWHKMQYWDIEWFVPPVIWRWQCRHNHVVLPMQNSWDLLRWVNCLLGRVMCQDVDSVRSILLVHRKQPV